MYRVTQPQLPLVIVGAGGHARVLHALARMAGYEILGVCDPRLTGKGEASWLRIPVLGGDEALSTMDPSKIGVINGIGQLPGSEQRRSVYCKIKQLGFAFPPLIHPTAFVDETVILHEGAQVMAGAIIQPYSIIGENTVVNTKASIDHDCRISAHVHVAPAATLCGGVSVGEGVFIGAGSTVIQEIVVGMNALIGAGTVLTRNIPKNCKVRARSPVFFNRE